MKQDAPLLIGAHTSAAGGAFNALLEGREIGATTIQFFTSNQRRWDGKPLERELVEKWQKTLAETGLKEIMSHDSYLINLGAAKEEILIKSRKAFQEEIERCLDLGVTYLNFHPGAAVGGSEERCLDIICESLLSYERFFENQNLTLLLETTAGQGSSVGWKFEHLAHIMEKVKRKIPIGVCIDTCHIFAAGYDIRTQENWNQVLNEFDSIIGLSYLRAFHLNDSQKDLGCRIDRHKPLGAGKIGWECFKFLMTDPRTQKIPKYLETPDGPELWKKEIQALRAFAKQEV